jgi:hypothetical protein
VDWLLSSTTGIEPNLAKGSASKKKKLKISKLIN